MEQADSRIAEKVAIMSSSWVRRNLHSEPISKVPDTEYPIAVRGYGGM